ncbi:carboxypeptidase-like regulatory domain-containing protein [Labilibacter sediminis]|nr:carboxypeptidase-like regulatory domain-containing protein [Labilibacter sediminis]
MRYSHKLVLSILLVSIFNLFSIVKGQNVNIVGVVTNAETGNAVEFANIGIENTYLGTASDMDGYFELVISETLSDKTIRVSAVGFKSKAYAVKDWLIKDSVKIQLTPVNYGISEVSVEAKSKIGYGIIRSTSNLVSDNYPQQALTYKCYVNAQSFKGDIVKKTESILLLSDAEGYKTPSFTHAYQNRNYKIVEDTDSTKTGSLLEGVTMIDQIINQDIVRCAGNILSLASINDFKVEVIGEDVIQGDSVWVIQYDCKTPTIQNSGDPELVKYSGEIFINKEDNAVLKNSIEAIRKGMFIHGNSFNNITENQQEITYKAETSYVKKSGKYVLNSIDYSLIDEVSNIKEHVFLQVVEVTEFDKSIINRQYYNNTEVDVNFWQTYKRPLDN